jgi:hypothetical protein
MENALATRAPSAAAKPSGRQQLIIATELRIAASSAEMPVPCFKRRFLRGPRRRRDAASQQEEDRFRPSPDKSGSSSHVRRLGESLPASEQGEASAHCARRSESCQRSTRLSWRRCRFAWHWLTAGRPPAYCSGTLCFACHRGSLRWS